MSGVKSQQHRWAKGSIQTAKKLQPRVLRADVSRVTLYTLGFAAVAGLSLYESFQGVVRHT